MNPTDTCFEIVHFAFLPEVSLPAQTEAMMTIGRWAAVQPGFRARQCYFDPQQSRWTDVVEWEDLNQAVAAMTRIQTESELAPTMALIAPGTVHAGHFQRRI